MGGKHITFGVVSCGGGRHPPRGPGPRLPGRSPPSTTGRSLQSGAHLAAHEQWWTTSSPPPRSSIETPRQPHSWTIWVRGYPGPGAPLRISPNGGTEPLWARDGRALYYVEGRALMRVTDRHVDWVRSSARVGLRVRGRFPPLPGSPRHRDGWPFRHDSLRCRRRDLRAPELVGAASVAFSSCTRTPTPRSSLGGGKTGPGERLAQPRRVKPPQQQLSRPSAPTAAARRNNANYTATISLRSSRTMTVDIAAGAATRLPVRAWGAPRRPPPPGPSRLCVGLDAERGRLARRGGRSHAGAQRGSRLDHELQVGVQHLGHAHHRFQLDILDLTGEQSGNRRLGHAQLPRDG